MKKNIILIIAMIITLITLSPSVELVATSEEDYPQIVYLDLAGCEVCKEVKDHGVLTGLESQGVNVIIYDVMENPLMADKYAAIYNVEGGKAAPIIFAGDTYYRGADDIIDAYESGAIYARAHDELRDLSSYQADDYTFIGGLLLVIFAGLLDGINPCAIAMLLVFISIIGLAKSKRVSFVVSFTYIGSIFITYLAIGFGFLTLLGLSRQVFNNISYVLYGFFAILTALLFIFTFYDFFVTRNQEYGKVKNQLPKVIKKFNEKVIVRFSALLENKQESKGRWFWIIAIPAIIGVIIGITEAACTGQIYIAVLASIEANSTRGYLESTEIFYIFVFNLMFVTPLIIIAIVATKTKSVMAVSNFVRGKLHITKLITAIFFLSMSIYFFYYLITL